MSFKGKRNKDLAHDLAGAGIIAPSDSIGIEHLRFAKGHGHRRDRFDRLIQATFKLSPTTPGAKSAHLVAFHMILPKKVPAAMDAAPYAYGGAVYIDYMWEKDAPLERRQLCSLTFNAFGTSGIDAKSDLQAFLLWLRTVSGYQITITDSLVDQLTFDMLAWGARNIPYPLWSHSIGLRPMQPLPKSTLARIESGLALDEAVDEQQIDREVRIADMLDAMTTRPHSGVESARQSDIKIIEDAKALLKTRRHEKPEVAIDRWVTGLLNLHPRLEAAEFSCALVLNWMTDLSESGTVNKWDMRHYTRRRYITCGASAFHIQSQKIGTHPSTWTPDQVDAMCQELMSDTSIKDKLGLGAAISSFFTFLHLNFGSPIPTRGIHALIPESIPRAQFVTESEVQRAIGWTYSSKNSDLQLLAIVRTGLALGWGAPFRLQELLNLEIRNIAEGGDGGYEIEILPKGWHAPLKTPAAMRRVHISKGWAADLLREFLDMRYGQGASGKSRLFANEEDPDVVYRKYTVQALMLRLLKTATGDPEMTFHALRHSWASVEVEKVLASSSIANYNRLSHIAAEMGHVSAVSTLQFYSHFFEFPLNCHITSTVRDIIQMGNGAAEIHLNEKSNTTLQRWHRKFGWDTEQCIWHEIETRAAKIELQTVSSQFSLVDPSCPKFATHLVHPLHPMKIVRVLKNLLLAPHRQKDIANWNHLTESDVMVISESAIEIAHQFLLFNKKGRQEVANVSSVDGALAALHIDLHASNRTKYKDFRVGISVPLAIPAGFTAAWMQCRAVIRLPEPLVYFFLHPTSHVQPLLSLIKAAGVESTDLVIRVPSKNELELEIDVMKSDIAFAFQGIWGDIPEFRPVGYHAARSKPYLTFPGMDVPTGKESPVHAEVGGLDALLFSCAIYARSMEKKHGVA
jgi:integrase